MGDDGWMDGVTGTHGELERLRLDGDGGIHRTDGEDGDVTVCWRLDEREVLNLGPRWDWDRHVCIPGRQK
ncbi:hypothetical protein CPB84DRAFT_1783209 [Gymnopilus junonius]|uniref:Uncharacterized protein n=1 Tax=Gymnopilus junonius TaxID=109634 RepID=A0A9P5NLK8_GYMJU|nr:hypothetical protein CPB84DRAFT_1783209 [Gymnopilus junonius]